MLVESRAEDVLLHRPLPQLSDGVDLPVERPGARPSTAAAAALAHAGVERVVKELDTDGWVANGSCTPSGSSRLIDGGHVAALLCPPYRRFSKSKPIPHRRLVAIPPTKSLYAEELFWLALGCVAEPNPGADSLECTDGPRGGLCAGGHELISRRVLFRSDRTWEAKTRSSACWRHESQLGVETAYANAAHVHLWYTEKHGLPSRNRCIRRTSSRLLWPNTRIGSGARREL